MKKITALFLALLSGGIAVSAQTVTVKDTVYTTYGFSDPNPVPLTGSNIYPYHKFESFAFSPEQKEWKVVILENKWLRVRIMPEIGGKIWSVYDKTTGTELFYDNDVVKFREISLRGPWTSGGIEFNYGVIGHAPSCSHPVEWRTETKADGSVSCYIGVLELLTRTFWTVEINLPKDAARLRTRTFWHNHSGEYQPYYTWANSGVRASDDLELIYPAAYSIGHDGITTPYPVDEVGRDLSKYSDQAFGQDKSFHPGGTHKGFFGAYWKNDGAGVLHYSLRDEKIGRKYFSWAQSPQGEIWRGLLTDKSPQYVELQSGRLFNQNLLESVKTPFKQTLFAPFGTDEWNEYWLPFSGIGGADEVSTDAVVKLNESGDGDFLGIYPLKNMEGEALVADSEGKVIYSDHISLVTAQPFNIAIPHGEKAYSFSIDRKKLWSADTQEIDRPHKVNPEFSLDSAQGQMIYARYLYGMRRYAGAEEKVDCALAQDPSLVEALNLKALLCLHKMDFAAAYDAAGKVLAIDAYDPMANYLSGQAALALGKMYDAMDRFEVAAITSELRGAAALQLSKVHFICGDKSLSEDYARKSLVCNAYNVSAYEMLYQITPSEEYLSEIEKLDPLSPFPAIERMLSGEISAEKLSGSIREELKWQVYLEYAAFYSRLELKDKALKLIQACPQRNALLCAWEAWLGGDSAKIKELDSSSIELVFPFRSESFAPLEWAVENGGGWKASYMLAMLEDFRGNRDEASSLLRDLDAPYAPFYAFRASLTGSVDDLQKAASLDPQQWRYCQNLSLRYYSDGNLDAALKTIEPYYSAHKDNFHIGDTYLKILIAKGQYAKADKVISKMRILPFEGQSGSHVMWREIKLHLAAECIDKGNYKAALKRIDEALQWPETLGVGKPYDDLLDLSDENVLYAIVYSRMGDKAKAEEHLSKVSDDQLRELYRKATGKSGGKYAKVAPLLSGGSAAADRKLF